MKSGDIVLIQFPFTNIESKKKRPALVLSVQTLVNKNHNVLLAMITSNIEGIEYEGDVLLQEWKDSGLLHPSKVRFSKVATIDFSLIDKKIGRLVKKDIASCKKAFAKVFADWIE